MTASLVRASGGEWLLTYEFAQAAPAWLFNRTTASLDGEAWRAASWRVETAGVTLERRGSSDMLVGSGAPLTSVRIRVRPYQLPLSADYTPFVPFSDGGLAIFSGHYALIPVAGLGTEAIANAATLDPPPYRLIVRSPGHRLLLNGTVRADEATLAGDVAETYVYAGPSEVRETPAFAAVIDPGLPSWIKEELEGFVPRLLELYRARLGRPATARPMVLAAWGGDTGASPSFSGGVRPGLVTLEFAGARLAAPSDAMRDRVRGFLAHETAHFWMGHTVRYSSRSEAWITEGAADLLALRALQSLFPTYDHEAALARAAAECVSQVGPSVPLEAAVLRGGRAPYGCGALLLAAAESPAVRDRPGVDAFTFVAALVEQNRTDGVVSRDEWLEHFAASTGDPELASAIRGFITSGTGNPGAFLERLSARRRGSSPP